MKKAVFTLCLAVCLAVVSVPVIPADTAAAASHEVRTGEIVSTVNFRDKPSLSGDRIRYLKKGETVDIIREVNAYWLEVRDAAGQVGFVSSSEKYIRIQTRTVGAEAIGWIVSTVNFRTGPSTSAAQIRYLKKGETVEVIRKVNDYWLEVRDAAGQTGFVSSLEKYIQIEAQDKNAAFEPNGQIISTVNFRTGPSTSASRIRYLQKGELIQIIEKVNAYWFKAIDASGTEGYLSTNPKYVETFFGETPAGEEPIYEDEPNGMVVRSVSFRTGPSTSAGRIRYLSANEPLWIIDKVNSYWFKVKDKNGVQGYVSSSPTYVHSEFVEAYKQWDRTTIAEKVIQAGLAYLGTPYEFGSSRNDTSTFDCSDFVRQAYLDGIGYRLPGDSRSQGEHLRNSGNPIVTDWRQLQPGDLMFFMDYKGFRESDYAGIDKQSERITHVGIYLGNGQVLHTYSVASGGVRTNEIAGTQWEYRFLFGGYPIP